MPRALRFAAALVLAFGVAAGMTRAAAQSQEETPPPVPPSEATIPPSPPPQQPADAAPPQAPTEPVRPAFAEWLAGVRADALARGIRPAILDEALGSLTEPLPIVIERDRTQAEIVLSLEQYVERRLTKKFLATGREMYASHRATLEAVSGRYGVSPRIVAAIWGIESNFGRFAGVRPTIATLATLAWDPRRSTFFRGELLDALAIADRGDIELSRMRGSWAGAMGQVQFMPSSYLKYAEDFDGDGRRDIWSSDPDVFASIANYLKEHGWTPDQPWGREVIVPAAAARKIAADVARRTGTCQATRDMTVWEPTKEWQRLGIRLPGGRALPASSQEASIVSGAKKHYLVYHNYDALLDYNCAHSYAVTVGLIADRIGGGGPAAAEKVTRKTRHGRPRHG